MLWLIVKCSGITRPLLAFGYYTGSSDMFVRLTLVIAVVFLVIGLYSWDRNMSLSDLISETASSTPTTTAETKVATPVKQIVPKPSASVGTGVRTYENGFYVTTIYLTDQGFVPSTVDVTHGEEVRFVNKTTSVMRVIAEEKSSSLYYRSISQPGTLPKQDTYQMGLPEVGVFNYYDLNSNPRKSGQIVIK